MRRVAKLRTDLGNDLVLSNGKPRSRSGGSAGTLIHQLSYAVSVVGLWLWTVPSDTRPVAMVRWS